MPGRGRVVRGALTAAALSMVACGGAADAELVREPAPASTTTPPPATLPPVTAPPATLPPVTEPPPEPPPAVPPAPRVVLTPAWGDPFGIAAGLVLVHPAAAVERVGFHESNHDGAQTFEAAPTAASPMALESRERGTAPNSAADIVVDPDGEIRAPVSGVVKRAGGYVLYCRHRDDYVVIRPDSHPGLEVKILHISGVQVAPGDRVEAAETVLAPRPTRLPFESQVDETTAEPAWPHVHIEVVDPTVKDRPSPGGGC